MSGNKTKNETDIEGVWRDRVKQKSKQKGGEATSSVCTSEGYPERMSNQHQTSISKRPKYGSDSETRKSCSDRDLLVSINMHLLAIKSAVVSV